MIITKLFQPYSFIISLSVPVSNINGPFSFNAPYRDEHPGPPFNHSTTGNAAPSA